MSTVSIAQRMEEAKGQEALLRRELSAEARETRDRMLDIRCGIREVHYVAQHSDCPAIRTQATDWLTALLGPTVEP